AAGRSVACAAKFADNSEHQGDESQFDWVTENAYLAGLAHLSLGAPLAAMDELKKAAVAKASPSARPAQALLGLVNFTSGQFDEGARWWQMLDPKQRAAWKLNESLGGAVFLTALEAYREGRFEQAAEKFRAAGRLGHR